MQLNQNDLLFAAFAAQNIGSYFSLRETFVIISRKER